MLLARIDGNAVSTIKHPSLKGWRLALCQPLNAEGGEEGAPVLAVDPYQAGIHQRVLLTTDGVGIRERMKDAHSPVRYLITSILDD